MEKSINKQSEKINKVGLIILVNITLTKQQLIEELKTKTPEEREEIFAEFQKNDKEKSVAKKEIFAEFQKNDKEKSVAKKENLDELLKRISAEIKAEKEAEQEAEQEAKYAALRPEGLSHASQDTQDYRKRLEDGAIQGDNEALKEMEFFQGKFSYNADGTVNLIQLNETFCADLTGNGGTRNWTDAKELAEAKGYRLLTDYNDDDSERKKNKTDWYKLEQYFGKYANTGAIASMLGCVPGRYWTDTKYGIQKCVALIEKLPKYCCPRNWNNTLSRDRVCGFKKMNTAA